MMIFDILAGTPWWVYAIFVYLVMRGVYALQSQTIPLLRLIIIPLIFISWSMFSLYKRNGLLINSFSIWAMFFAMGALLGRIFLFHRITVDKKNMLVHIPGSVYPLILYMLFFVIKYSTGFMYATSPETYRDLSLWLVDAGASGFISGIFSGRFIHIFQKYNMQ